MKKNVEKIYAEALFDALKDKEDITPVISRFLDLLKEKKLLHKVDKILKKFEEIFNTKNSIHKLYIESAYQLDEEVVKQIANALKLENYETTFKINKDLISGFLAKYKDNLIDLSAKNQLKRLHNKLTK